MNDMTYEIDKKFKWVTVREKLFEALLRNVVDSYYSSSDGTHRDSPAYCLLCGNWIDVRLYSDAIERNIDHGPLCPVKLAERALAPDADYRALMKEMGATNDTDTD